MSDYKFDAQMIAEDLAESKFGEGVEYWSLPKEVQERLYKDALELVAERREAHAEWMRDRQKERERGY